MEEYLNRDQYCIHMQLYKLITSESLLLDYHRTSARTAHRLWRKFHCDQGKGIMVISHSSRVFFFSHSFFYISSAPQQSQLQLDLKDTTLCQLGKKGTVALVSAALIKCNIKTFFYFTSCSLLKMPENFSSGFKHVETPLKWWKPPADLIKW